MQDKEDYPSPPPEVQEVLDRAAIRPNKLALGKKASTCPTDHLFARHIVECASEAADALGSLTTPGTS